MDFNLKNNNDKCLNQKDIQYQFFDIKKYIQRQSHIKACGHGCGFRSPKSVDNVYKN